MQSIHSLQKAPGAHARSMVASFLALLQGGWMAFDGLHALTTGDYVAASGRDGLGPWAMAVAALTLDPTSMGVKVAFVAFGLFGLAAAALHVFRPSHAAWRRLLAVFAAGTLWYLPVGTALGLATLALLASTGRSGGVRQG